MGEVWDAGAETLRHNKQNEAISGVKAVDSTAGKEKR